MTAEQASDDLGLRLITSLCGSSNCPTVYSSNRGTVVVQGYPVSASAVGIDIPDGEFLVEIPEHILLDAAARHASRPEA